MASRLILKFRVALAVLALALPPVAFLASMAGWVLFDREAIGLAAGFTWLAVCAGLGAAAIAVLLVGRSAGWISWRWMALLALPALVPLAAGAYTLDWLRRHPSLPDVVTDVIDPPAFGRTATPFAPGLAEPLRRRFPEVRSLTLAARPPEAYALALDLAHAQGWTVTAASAQDGVIEGRGRFGRFGDERQWTVRIRPELGGGSIADFRIRSLTDTPDFGHNGEVAAAFLARLRVEAGET